jgi:putative thioredoxin
MNEPSSAAFRGAVDLSKLSKPAAGQAAGGAAAGATGGAQAAGQVPGAQAAGAQTPGSQPAGGPVAVPSLVIDVTQATLATYFKISDRVPVLVEFTTLRHEDSQSLSQKLAEDVLSRNGEVVLLRLDGDQAPEMVTAFQLPSLPSVAALIKGQPVPMFAGDQDAAAIKDIITRVIALAKENGVAQVAVADATVEPAKPSLPPRHQAAYDFIEAGNYAAAVKEFEAALNEAPGDVIAATGIAQAKLLERTENANIEEVLAAPAQELADVLNKADCLAVIGHFDMSFKALLDTFEVATREDREVLRAHLLELFKVSGNGHPAVAAARSRLTNLLY